MKSIKMSELVSQEKIANSITIEPVGKRYLISYFLKAKTKKGICKRRNIIADSIIEDFEIPYTSISTVRHLGYNSYQFLEKFTGFYINFYKF